MLSSPSSDSEFDDDTSSQLDAEKEVKIQSLQEQEVAQSIRIAQLEAALAVLAAVELPAAQQQTNIMGWRDLRDWSIGGTRCFGKIKATLAALVQLQLVEQTQPDRAIDARIEAAQVTTEALHLLMGVTRIQQSSFKGSLA